jgi:hypothetical protein
MMKKFLDKIRTEGINPDIVREIIDEHKTDHDRMLKLYERYKASVEGVPIFQRKPVEYEDFETGAIKRIDNKVNNTLNNAFDACSAIRLCTDLMMTGQKRQQTA